MWVALLLAYVVDGHKVGMCPQAGHRLRLAHDALTGQVVEAFGAYLGEGNVAVEGGVVGQEDALAAALAEEPFDPVAARYEG